MKYIIVQISKRRWVVAEQEPTYCLSDAACPTFYKVITKPVEKEEAKWAVQQLVNRPIEEYSEWLQSVLLE